MVAPTLLDGYFTIAKVGRKALPTVQQHEGLHWRVITPENLDAFLDKASEPAAPTLFEYDERLVFDNCVLDGVDLSVITRQIHLNGCVAINSKLPAKSIITESTLINTPTKGNSLFINTHMESGRSGRCDVGADSFLKDCSVFNGMVLNSGSVMLSCISFGTKHIHMESDVTIYGGTHYKNTYDKGVDVVYISPAEVRGAYMRFLDRNNDQPGFCKVMEPDSVYTHAEVAIGDALLKSCKVVYPDNISSADYLISKTLNERNVGDFIRAEHKGQEMSHEVANRRLLENCIASKARMLGGENSSIKKAGIMIDKAPELLDECARAYRRHNGALMTGHNDNSVVQFQDDFLIAIYNLHHDPSFTVERAVDAVIESADKHLESSIDRGGAYNLIETADNYLTQEVDATHVLSP